MRRLFKGRFKYYVVYKYQGGHGATTITMDEKMETEESIKAVEGYIKEKNNFDIVILENWIRLTS